MSECTDETTIVAAGQNAVIGIVVGLDPALDRSVVSRIVCQIAHSRTRARELSRVLLADPDLLTSGRPEGPKMVERLIRALQEAGSDRVVLPCCAMCGRRNRLHERDGEGRRICTPCALRTRAAVTDCGGCGNRRALLYRDRNGSLLCRPCSEKERTPDPLNDLLDQLVELGTGLDRENLQDAVMSSVPNEFQQQRVSWDLADNPSRLQTNAAESSLKRTVELAEELIRRGATNIAVPQCCFCGSTKAVCRGREGKRCCRPCNEAVRKVSCAECGRECIPSARDHRGRQLCATCYRHEPENHERCSSCRRMDLITRRDDTGQYCRRCWPSESAVCATCNRYRPCTYAKTEAPICSGCSRKRYVEICAKCHRERILARRLPDGRALCSTCGATREPCADCRKNKKVSARTERGPLCRNCYDRDPTSYRACDHCGSVERLFHFGMCPRCAADRALDKLFADDRGRIPARLDAAHKALAMSDPLPLLNWIFYSPAIPPLRRLLEEQRPITHEALDELLPNKAVHAMRSVLVAHGALPARDEQLTSLKRWIASFLSTVQPSADRKLLHTYAEWHCLPRLRRHSQSAAITAGQDSSVRTDLRNIAALLAWLRERNLDLNSCGQPELDAYYAGVPRYRAVVIAKFLRWASAQGHASKSLTGPPRPDPTIDALEADERWALTHKLIHDADINRTDRFAGLLVLLLGQRITTIIELTHADVTRQADKVMLRLGVEPVQLPPPMDDLALKLIEDKRTFMRVGRFDEHTWLFPGGHPGRHISNARLAIRLNRLGISCRRGRNATLLELAAQLPASVISKLLGISVKSAARWTAWSGGHGTRYAAEVARRS